MITQKLTRYLSILAVVLVALALLTTTGCKKKMGAEQKPAEKPKIEETTTPTNVDTTGNGAKERQSQMDADKARIQTVYFDYDKSDIRADMRDKIKGNAEVLRKWSDWSVAVEGNCDERGTPEYNLALGERRANAAMKALAAEGIDSKRLNTVSYGEERPMDPGHTEASWAHNRRAEFKVK